MQSIYSLSKCHFQLFVGSYTDNSRYVSFIIHLLTSMVTNHKRSIVYTRFGYKTGLVCLFLLGLASEQLYGQAELAPWGNILGIRVEGQLMEFESSLRVVGSDWTQIGSTGKEKQRPRYTREGTKQVVATNLNNSLSFTESVENIGKGLARVEVQFTSKVDTTLLGAFFSVMIPDKDYAAGSIQPIGAQSIAFNKLVPNEQNEYLRTTASGLRLSSLRRQLEITFSEPTLIILRKESEKGHSYFQLYLPIHQGSVRKDQTVQKTFTIKASGKIDRKPVKLTLNTAQQGREFAGFGGNFRLQNPNTDPPVIDYCLQNMRVAWGRVEMPWRFWQPEKGSNPIEAAKAGKLDMRVQKAMEMAQKLQKLGMPIILSAWSGPRWAIEGEPNYRPRPDGVWGNPLDKASMKEIYQSIADYVLYLKENYGVDVRMFSFNESDLGINIRMTGEEHAEFIKGLGTHFVSRGLKTKLLLGDNSDATTYEFIYPAMKDATTHPYIGAISFHSWRGWERETLEKWADAAKKLNLPLIVGEGSIDAAAWNYPAVFEEPSYALAEINLYTRLLAICQPITILQWQLTADYSPLVGGGIFGNNEPLRPTQRFWNLKQLASTPENVVAMAITNDRSDISCAALGNTTSTTYAIHLVNNGTTREVTLTGIPGKVKEFRIYVTDKQRAMKEGKRVVVSKGQAKFTLDTGSYTTLMTQ